MQAFNSFGELASNQVGGELGIQSPMSIFNAPYPSFRGCPIDIRTEKYDVDEQKGVDGDTKDIQKIVSTKEEKRAYHDRLRTGQKFYGVIPSGCTTIPGLKPNENVLYGDMDNVEACYMEDEGAGLKAQGYIPLPKGWTTKIIY